MTLAYSPLSLSPQAIEDSLFERASQRSFFEQAWALLSKKSQKLEVMTSIVADTEITPQFLGQREVALTEIQGCYESGKQREFDRSFRPLTGRSRERWLNIAKARRQGKRLSPVKLIQYGGNYFVKDGCHRISVARALGDTTIEAEVVTC